MAETTSANDAKAFDFIEGILYILALLVCSQQLFLESLNKKMGLYIAVSKIIIELFLIVVFLRNYTVMHGIDNSSHLDNQDALFLNGNTRPYNIIERALRAAIVLVVVTSPRGSISFINISVAFLQTTLENFAATAINSLIYAVSSAFPNLPIGHTHKLNTSHTELIPYYGSVLGILFVLFLAWDMTNILSIGRRIRTGVLPTSLASIEDISDRRELFSLMKYLNLCKMIDRDDGSSMIQYDRNLYSKGVISTINKGNIQRIYISSAKFLERLFGLLAALSIILVSVTNYRPLPTIMLSACVIIYLFMASKNDRFGQSISSDFGRTLASYFTSGARGGNAAPKPI